MTDQVDIEQENLVHPTEKIESDASGEEQLSTSDYKEFPWGIALKTTSTNVITQKRQTRLIIIAGGVKAGKSTLLSSIYEKFYEGSFKTYLFAGSKTLLEFERICHDSRIASNRKNAETERTKLSDSFKFLHLLLHNKTTNKKQDLLFTDVSGEIFENIRDSSEECRRHSILKRCDHFALLLDGEKLSNPETRGVVVSDGAQIIRRLLDNEILGIHSLIYILVTKFDIISDKIKKDSTLETYIEIIKETKFLAPFKSRVSNIHICNIAARPNEVYSSELELGYGVEDLIEKWVENYPLTRIKQKESEPTTYFSRVIDRFKPSQFNMRTK